MLARLKEIIGAAPWIRSAWGHLHLLKFRHDLRREETAYQQRQPRDEQGFPLPPPHLRFRISNTFNEEIFVDMGNRASASIRGALTSVGYELDQFQEVLDFGCGCGRVIRSIHRHAPSGRFHGCDIDAEAIGWCDQNLGALATWTVNPPGLPFAYPENSFDLIYGISVFTHLDADMQFFWLGELHRVARPGAVLLLTVHGQTLAAASVQQGKLSVARLAQLEREGILFCEGYRGKLKLDGLPDFYQTAFHTREYITNNWSRYFELIRYIERKHQDIVVLRKRETDDPASQAQPRHVSGAAAINRR